MNNKSLQESKFTPGDWEWSQAEHGDVEVRSVDGDFIAIVVLDGDTETRDANANLIAAAPDLYAVLDALTASVRVTRGVPSFDVVLLNQARAALAKARGES